LQFCWRGERLPSHKANCTGCDCAQWSLKLGEDGSTLESQFQQSPPSIHMQISLVRTDEPIPSPTEVAQGWNCKFSNYTGFPNHTTSTSAQHSSLDKARLDKAQRSLCPFKKVDHGRVTPLVDTMDSTDLVDPTDEGAAPSGSVPNCMLINYTPGPDNVIAKPNLVVKLEYTAAQLPCWPCNVHFTLSIATPTPGAYIAIGFKESYAAYYGFDKVRDLDQYWGMATSKANSTELAGRIIAGHFTPSGQGCVRHMEADAYVGSVTDVHDDGRIFNTSMQFVARSPVGPLTQLSFTANLHAGRTQNELSWSERVFGEQRIMWATGAMDETTINDGCSASLGYHFGMRGLASLNFPGFGQKCPF